MITKNRQLINLLRFVYKKMSDRYFGKLDLRLEDGNVVHMSTHNAHKIDSLSEAELAKLPADVQEVMDRVKDL